MDDTVIKAVFACVIEKVLLRHPLLLVNDTNRTILIIVKCLAVSCIKLPFHFEPFVKFDAEVIHSNVHLIKRLRLTLTVQRAIVNVEV